MVALGRTSPRWSPWPAGTEGGTIRDVVVPGIWPGLDVVPTVGITLGAVRDELVIAGAEWEGRLREALPGSSTTTT